MSRISVIGAGSWGTALAQVVARQDRDVMLWARNPETVQEINTSHTNTAYLGNIPLSQNIKATQTLEVAMHSEILLMVTPAQSMRSILQMMKPSIKADQKLVLCSKGLERDTSLLLSDISHQILPHTPVAILTGPNFATEIAAGKPAATTLACTDEAIGRTIQDALACPFFRPYLTHDIIGAQIAGALKNVIAISCGIAHGLQMGESARASLVTRGLAEIARLGVKMGGETETFLGLCGVGDMMLTCSSEQSRNFSLGYAMGQGQTLEEIQKASTSLAEGVFTAKAAVNIANKYGIDMPICLAVHKCLNEGLSLDHVMQDMLNRPVGHE